MNDEEKSIVTACAALAPSVHNTQPWIFTWQANVLEVAADRSRQLPYLDATGRLLHTSCGAAIEYARLAIRAAGYACSVQFLPHLEWPQLLATLSVEGEEEPTAQESTLTEAIARRYTDRGPYEARAVPASALADAATRATQLDSWLRVITNHDDRLAVTLILNDAESAEASDPAYGAELRRWTRDDQATEGMPTSALEGHWPLGRVSDLPLRDFSGHNAHLRISDLTEAPPTVERDSLLLVGTRTDTPTDWLAAGGAVGWLLLRLAVDGVSAQPLGPATDFAESRGRLRHDLGLVGWPQFLLRAGYGLDRPRTRRRIADNKVRST